MATAESVKAKIQGLIDSANTTTGSADADLTTAVGSLIAGFGQGGGGGLPAGITALASGTFTPATDQTSKLAITHGLGTMPNFFIVLAEGAPLAIEDFTQYCVSQFSVAQPYIDGSSSNTQRCYTIIRYGMASGRFSETRTSSSVLTSFANDSIFYCYAATGQKLKAGVTYRWIAGVVDGI